MLDSAVLLLNQNYEPLTTCSARRAIIMLWSGKAELVESSGLLVHSVSLTFDVPSIIRLLIYVSIRHHGSIQLSKQNILRRDHKTCPVLRNPGRADDDRSRRAALPRWRRHMEQSCMRLCPMQQQKRGPAAP